MSPSDGLIPSSASQAPCGPLRLGIIGLGRMAQALLLPLLECGELAPAEVGAAVASEASAARLRHEIGRAHV